MKTRYLIDKALLFIAIFLLFLMAPLLQNSAGESIDFSKPSVLLISFLEFFSSAVILLLCKRLYSIPIYGGAQKILFDSRQDAPTSVQNHKTRAFLFLKDAGDVFLCFGVLCVFSALLHVAAFLLPSGKPMDVIFPSGLKWFVCILTLFFSAFYEEALYRIFVPEYLLSIFTKDMRINSAKAKKITSHACELFALILFALSHRYLGVFSVVNAAFAHTVFRFFLKKDKNLFITVFAHFLYNVISLVLI